MKITTKLVLCLVAVVFLTVSAVQAVQYRRALGQIDKLSESLVSVLQDWEKQVAENIFISVERSVAGSLERGEMDKFDRILEAQRKIKGLLAFSLYDAKGVVRYSSDPKAVNKVMEPGRLKKLAASTGKLYLTSDQAVDILDPILVKPDCVRCHTTWKNGDVCGFNGLSFSRQAIAAAKAQTAQAVENFSSSWLLLTVVAVSVTVIIFVLGMAFTVNRFVRSPLRRVVGMLKKYDVDLTLEMPVFSKDEIGEMAGLLNGFVNKLNGVIGNAQQAAEVVGDGADSQAATVEQISATIEQISATTKENADNSQAAKQMMGEVRSGVQDAGDTISALHGAMRDLDSASRQVSDIMGTIDGIAFQTNLLALNAAVEAARAGDAGAGFAVVADEVRNLALRSAEAAQSTSQLISETLSRIEQSNTMVDRANEMFEQLRGHIGKAGDLVNHISEASQEQARGVSEANSALHQIDAATQSNAAQARELTEVMGTFETAFSKNGVNVGDSIKPVGQNKPAAALLPEPGEDHAGDFDDF